MFRIICIPLSGTLPGHCIIKKYPILSSEPHRRRRRSFPIFALPSPNHPSPIFFASVEHRAGRNADLPREKKDSSSPPTLMDEKGDCLAIGKERGEGGRRTCVSGVSDDLPNYNFKFANSTRLPLVPNRYVNPPFALSLVPISTASQFQCKLRLSLRILEVNSWNLMHKFV